MLNGVFRSSDASLVLAALAADETDPENVAAGSVMSQYGLTNAVGRVQGLSVRVTSDVRPVFEIGSRHAVSVRPGLISVSGQVARVTVNGAMLALLLGSAAQKEPQESAFAQPAFNIVATLRDASRTDASMTVTVFGVRFSSWELTVPLEDVVLEDVGFRAARVSVVESEP